MKKRSVPKSLRTWFIIHFFVDIIFGIPLLFFPEWTLGLFGIIVTETIMARLVGAALIGIGGASFFSYNKDKAVYDALLSLKILWSVCAIVGLIIAISTGAPRIVWLIVLIFAIFSGVWIYYKFSSK